jgi:hypothetical protein
MLNAKTNIAVYGQLIIGFVIAGYLPSAFFSYLGGR